MTQIDGALVRAVKYFRPKSKHIEDQLLSSVHYKLAFGVVLVCAVLTGLTSWYSPIECMKPASNEFELSFVKQWCYANSSFIVEGPAAEEAIFPFVHNKYSSEGNRVVYIRYYQWVTLCLMIQAAFFQAPRVLWKTLERERVRKLVEQLQAFETAADEERDQGIAMVAARFANRRRADHVRYLHSFLLCQALYFINIIVQIAVTQGFLNGRFISLMPRWLSGQRVLDAVFPKIVKCDLRSYGSGGSAQSHNTLCLLAMNVLNEKVYLLLWAVFLLALVVSIVQIVFIAMMMLSSHVRNSYLGIDDGGDAGNNNNNNKNDPFLHYGEWLLLKFVKDNLDDSQLFTDFIDALAQIRQGGGDPDQFANIPVVLGRTSPV